MRLSIIIVCFGDELGGLLADLAEQRRPGDEVIVVDNLPAEGGTPSSHDSRVDTRLAAADNPGFGAGINRGAARAGGDVLLLLNPDCRLRPGCLDALRDPPPEWAAWMGVVELPDGLVNTSGNVAHFLGLGWVGGFGEPAAELPERPYPTGFLSGACLAIWAEVFERVGRFPEHFFLYGEDLDLSNRLRLTGAPFGVVPAARVVHDYAFEKGSYKWRWLERNRWALVLRTYPAPLLGLVLPAMLACELPLLAVAAAQGWIGPKLGSWLDVLRWLPRGRSERRAVQALRRVAPGEFAAGLESRLSSPLLGAVGRSRFVNAVTGGYWALVRALLRRAAAAPEQH